MGSKLVTVCECTYRKTRNMSKPYRMASSFELCDKQPLVEVKTPKRVDSYTNLFGPLTPQTRPSRRKLTPQAAPQAVRRPRTRVLPTDPLTGCQLGTTDSPNSSPEPPVAPTHHQWRVSNIYIILVVTSRT